MKRLPSESLFTNSANCAILLAFLNTNREKRSASGRMAAGEAAQAVILVPVLWIGMGHRCS